MIINFLLCIEFSAGAYSEPTVNIFAVPVFSVGATHGKTCTYDP